MNGLRMGTPELVRWGMKVEHMPQLAKFIADVLLGKRAPEAVALEVSAWRKEFAKLHYIR